jgi:hypothetical protein
MHSPTSLSLTDPPLSLPPLLLICRLAGCPSDREGLCEVCHGITLDVATHAPARLPVSPLTRTSVPGIAAIFPRNTTLIPLRAANSSSLRDKVRRLHFLHGDILPDDLCDSRRDFAEKLIFQMDVFRWIFLGRFQNCRN